MNFMKKISAAALLSGMAITSNAEVITLEFEFDFIEHHIANQSATASADPLLQFNQLIDPTNVTFNLVLDSQGFSNQFYSSYNNGVYGSGDVGTIESYQQDFSNLFSIDSIFSRVEANYRANPFKADPSSYQEYGSINSTSFESNSTTFAESSQQMYFSGSEFESSITSNQVGNIQTDSYYQALYGVGLTFSETYPSKKDFSFFNTKSLIQFFDNNSFEYEQMFTIYETSIDTDVNTQQVLSDNILIHGAESMFGNVRLSNVNGLSVDDYLASIPEPSSIALFGLASLGLLGFRKKRV